MKVTVLVFDEKNKGHLRVADQNEWTAILKANRTGTGPRRYFILDSIWEFDDDDRMYIECTKEEFAKWHREAQNTYRKAKKNQNIDLVSYNVMTSDETEPIINIIDDNFDWGTWMNSVIVMRELRTALTTWKPWGIEMLELYMNNQKKQATKILSEKYGVSEQTIRLRKREFESFVVSFLLN